MVYKRVRGWTSGLSLPVKIIVEFPSSPGQSLSQGRYHQIYQEARKGVFIF